MGEASVHFTHVISTDQRSGALGWYIMQTTNAYFVSIKMLVDHPVKMGICGSHYSPSNPFLHVSLLFSAIPIATLFENSIFLLF